MGRRAYDMANGDFTGYEFQVPIFVVTHRPPKDAPKGQNANLSITFVTEGTEAAVQKAKKAAGTRDVTVVGGASTAEQCINAGLADELEVGIVPGHEVAWPNRHQVPRHQVTGCVRSYRTISR